ncbi:MAG: DUF11 domain-containing protein [Chloroflexi bacterium]|nr:DUF11 domain-containing protein [Chloroflexota bacterium]
MATATGTPPVAPDVTADDTKTVTTPDDPSILVVKSATPTSGLVVGDVITYTFDVTNTGNVTLTGVTLADNVLGTITLSDDAGDGVGTLAPGDTESGSVNHTVTPADVNGGTLTNVATATGTPPVGDDVDDEDQVEIPFVNLSVTKTSVVTPVMLDLTNIVLVFSSNGNEPDASASDTVVQFTEITYTITVTNNGDAVATGVVITDTLPAGTTFVSLTGGGSHSSGTVTWNIGTVAAHDGTNPGSVTVTVTVRT